jgi:hypothetical protein
VEDGGEEAREKAVARVVLEQGQTVQDGGGVLAKKGGREGGRER